jgi:hypothetical protein
MRTLHLCWNGNIDELLYAPKLKDLTDDGAAVNSSAEITSPSWEPDGNGSPRANVTSFRTSPKKDAITPSRAVLSPIFEKNKSGVVVKRPLKSLSWLRRWVHAIYARALEMVPEESVSKFVTKIVKSLVQYASITDLTMYDIMAATAHFAPAHGDIAQFSAFLENQGSMTMFENFVSMRGFIAGYLSEESGQKIQEIPTYIPLETALAIGHVVFAARDAERGEMSEVNSSAFDSSLMLLREGDFVKSAALLSLLVQREQDEVLHEMLWQELSECGEEEIQKEIGGARNGPSLSSSSSSVAGSGRNGDPQDDHAHVMHQAWMAVSGRGDTPGTTARGFPESLATPDEITRKHDQDSISELLAALAGTSVSSRPIPEEESAPVREQVALESPSAKKKTPPKAVMRRQQQQQQQQLQQQEQAQEQQRIAKRETSMMKAMQGQYETEKFPKESVSNMSADELNGNVTVPASHGTQSRNTASSTEEISPTANESQQEQLLLLLEAATMTEHDENMLNELEARAMVRHPEFDPTDWRHALHRTQLQYQRDISRIYSQSNTVFSEEQLAIRWREIQVEFHRRMMVCAGDYLERLLSNQSTVRLEGREAELKKRMRLLVTDVLHKYASGQ